MKKLIVANWKMHKDNAEALAFVKGLKPLLKGIRKEIAICPSFVAIPILAKASGRLKIGSQDMHQDAKGAFTGEVSAQMLAGLCDYAIIGHSERRAMFGETDEKVNLKAKAAIASGITPIICIGETAEQKSRGETQEVLKRQLTKAIEGIQAADAGKIVIAYEPVWAISGGDASRNPPTPDDAEREHKFIRKLYKEAFPQAKIRIIYGGSVKPDNAAGLLGKKDIDGALVGNASLEIEPFLAICKA